MIFYLKAEDVNKAEETSIKFFDLGNKIEQAMNEWQVVNRREAILKWKISDFTDIKKIKDTFLPYNKVWSLISNYNFKIPNIMNSAFNGIDKD